MALAYRQIATPVAVATGVVALGWNLVQAVQAARERSSEYGPASMKFPCRGVPGECVRIWPRGKAAK